jgi:hypothetical protein
MATTNTLKFSDTLSVAKFKAINGISKLNLIKSPISGKRFFNSPDDSKIGGKVSEAIDMSQELFISTCTDETTGDSFNMLHNTSNANVEAEF